METKLFEIRDRATFIPVVCTQMFSTKTEERYLLRRCGYAMDERLVIMTRLDGGEAQYDPYGWKGSRTMTNAHSYIENAWDELKSGDVVDVEYILGETQQPKTSERLEEAI